MEQIKIDIPEGYEIDPMNSDLSIGLIKYRLKEPKTYGDVMTVLRERYRLRRISHGEIRAVDYREHLAHLKNGDVSCSDKQLMNIMNLNRLINVATFLNNGWIPPNSRDSLKHFIGLQYSNLKSNDYVLTVGTHRTVQYSCVYFKSVQLAKEAISILGEDVIKSALTLHVEPIIRNYLR